MNRRDSVKRMLLAGGASLAGRGPSLLPAVGSQASPGKFRLIWSDEFDGPNGTPPNPRNWAYDVGGGGWGNQELETYTKRTQNSFVQDGNLVIQAFKETYTGSDGITRDYTSARLKTQGLIDWTYGRFKARMKLPSGKGLWPAFWMMGSNVNQAGWPGCGEIDIVENVGSEPSKMVGTIHGPDASGGYAIRGYYSLPNGARFADDFHVFSTEWDLHAIRLSVDGHLYRTVIPSDLPPSGKWVFNRPFFIILNVAVGGSWPGRPDASTVFPQRMLVDYVRVYQRQ